MDKINNGNDIPVGTEENEVKLELSQTVRSKYYPNQINEYPYIGLLNTYCPANELEFAKPKPYIGSDNMTEALKASKEKHSHISLVQRYIYNAVKEFTYRCLNENIDPKYIIEGQQIIFDRCYYYLGFDESFIFV